MGMAQERGRTGASPKSGRQLSTTPPRYDGHADSCDASRGEFADAAGRELLELLGAGPGGCLDLGCGTGINLPRLADAGWSVTGVDISADQLRLARRRVGDEIELVQAWRAPRADAP